MPASLFHGPHRSRPPVVTRRGFGALVAAATAAPVLAGCGAAKPRAKRSRTMDRVVYLTAFGTNGRDGYAHVASAKGFFAEAGVKVSIQGGKAGESNHLLLTSGQAHFASVDGAGAFIRYATGKDTGFRIVAAIQQSTLVSIVTMADRGIAGPRDLTDRTLGVAAGAVPHTLFPAYARLVGVDPKRVTWTNASPDQLPGLVIANRIDGAGLFLVAKPSVEAAAKGRKVFVLPYSDVLPDLYGAVTVTQKKTLAENPDLVRRFTRALLRGLEYAVTNPGEAGQILHAAEPTQDPKLAAAELDMMRPFVLPAGLPVGAIDRTRAAKNIALLKSVELVPAAADGAIIDQVVDFDTMAAVTR
jgi:NitT/TauT family transport system substrate-binding protein